MSTLKEHLLKALVDGQGSYFSGSALAEKYGVSRNAVWKAVKQLQNEGYCIDAVTNKGYAFISDDDILSEACIQKHLRTKMLGRKLRIYTELYSTNKTAKEAASEGAPHGTVILAEKQNGGHGRYGRPFFSPEKSGIYMTVLLRPHLKAEQSLLITSCTAVAAAEAIEKLFPVNVQIKWVNDLFVNQKKICGILTEAGIGFENGELEYVAIGIGINSGAAHFPKELELIAASLENESGIHVSRNRLIAEILNCLESHLETMADRRFLAESRRRSILLGKKINVVTMSETYPAVAEAINEDGFLIVRTEKGLETLNSGEVSIRFN